MATPTRVYSMSIGKDSDGMYALTLNGQTFTFDGGQLSALMRFLFQQISHVTLKD
jgi:hypothetical protein